VFQVFPLGLRGQAIVFGSSASNVADGESWREEGQLTVTGRAPGRTLTFIWGDEIRASRQWLTANPDMAKGVQYMFSLDMTGEDTAKTGGTFLIEKQPDPSAVDTAFRSAASGAGEVGRRSKGASRRPASGGLPAGEGDRGGQNEPA
jgi:hypothetical protein